MNMGVEVNIDRCVVVSMLTIGLSGGEGIIADGYY